MKKAGLILLMCLIFTNIAYALDDWRQQSPLSKPSARDAHAMAYTGEDKVLLFGGYDTTYDDETWIYDLSDDDWSQRSPSSAPSARQIHAMAYIDEDQVLLFGGYDGSALNDTWVYDLSDNTWTLQSPSSSPSARDGHAMAYIGEDKVLLFGGFDTTYDDETWIYDLSDDTWTQQTPTSGPLYRYYHAMAYIGGDQVMLFGGSFGSHLNDTWIYDLSDNTWTLQSPPWSPAHRELHAMAHIGGDQVMLFGGYSTSNMNDTWVYDLSDDTWIQDMNSTQPSARRACGLSETSIDGSSYPVLFGGYKAGGRDDQTWIFGEGDYLVLVPPSIDAINDVPYDQGRQVVILWHRSFLDNPGYTMITHYTIWRLYPYGDRITSLYPEWDGISAYDPDRPVYRVVPDVKGGDQRDYWEQIGSVSAHFLDQYAFTASTFEDSCSSGIPYFTFFVSAQTADPYVFFDSDPDSGYSVDNINPAPTQLQLQLAGVPSTLSLQWDQVTTGIDGSSELGGISYRIHSDTYPYFIPGPGNLLTTTSSLSYNHTDPGIGNPSTDLYYVIIATDGSDNQSGPSNRAGEIDFFLP